MHSQPVFFLLDLRFSLTLHVLLLHVKRFTFDPLPVESSRERLVFLVS